MLVGRGHLDEGHIDRHGAGPKQPWNIREVYGRVIGTPLGDGFPARGRNEKKTSGGTGQIRFRISGLPETEDMEYFKVGKRRDSIFKMLGQVLRFAAARTDKNTVPASDYTKRIFACTAFRL